MDADGLTFVIGLHRRILLFPQGNTALDQVAVYLDSAEPREQADPNWHICAQFALLMSNPNDPTVYVSHGKRKCDIYVPHLFTSKVFSISAN